MAQFSHKNINKPTGIFWSKVSAACSFVSASLLGMGITADTPYLLWTAFGLQIVAGVVVIFTNGNPVPFTRTSSFTVTETGKEPTASQSDTKAPQ